MPNSSEFIAETDKNFDKSDMRGLNSVEQCEIRLKQFIRHEVLHALRPSNPPYPVNVEEGIVNFLSLQAAQKSEPIYMGYLKRLLS